MTLKNFKVGMYVYVYLIGSNVRRFINSDNINDYIRRAVVTKVGRRYVTVKFEDTSREVMFDANDRFREKTEYSVDYALYLSVQDIYDVEECEVLIKKLREVVNSYYMLQNYNVGQLRAVCQILNIK